MKRKGKGWGGGASFMVERLCRGELVLIQAHSKGGDIII